MPKFRVVCREEVETEMIVDAPSRERLDAWLEEKGADAVSTLLESQSVHDRDYRVYLANKRDKTNFKTEDE